MPNEKIPLTDARRRLGAIVQSISNGDHVELTQHGYPFAVIIPITDYQQPTEATQEQK